MGHLGAILSPLGQKPEKDPKKDPKSSPKPIDFGGQNWHFFVMLGVIFWITFWSLFGPLLEPILDPFWDQIGPRRGQDEPKRAIKSSKEPKSCIFKNLKKPLFFSGFWDPEASKRASRSPRRLPRGTQGAPKPQKKGIQKWTPNLTIF